MDCGYYWTALSVYGDTIEPFDGGIWGPQTDEEEDRFEKNPYSDEFVHTVSSCLKNCVDSMSAEPPKESINYNDCFYVIFEDADSLDSDEDLAKLFNTDLNGLHDILKKIVNNVCNDGR